MKQRSKTLYFVYEDDTIIATGTVEQCAKDLGVSKRTVTAYGHPRTKARYDKGLTRRMAEKQNEIGDLK